MAKRTIIEINEDLCDGCGDCIISCAEGALKIVDGKAKLVSDVLCDGIGVCLGHCPQDAITLIERDAEEFDEAAVEQHQRALAASENQTTNQSDQATPHEPTPAPMCPGSQARSLKPPSGGNDAFGFGGFQKQAPAMVSELQGWPVQLHLLNPAAPFLANSDLLLCADCVPFAYPNFHHDFLKDHSIAIGCPKLDDVSPYVGKLTEMLQRGVNSLTVIFMEVPCCGGIVQMAGQALEASDVDIPVRLVKIGVRGDILSDDTFSKKGEPA